MFITATVTDENNIASIFLNHNHNCLQKYLNVQSNIPILYILFIQSHNFLKIRNITSPTNLPHPRNPRLYRQPYLMMRFIQIRLRNQRRSRPYNGHIPSLCQLRNNFFSKISHKAQYYQLTLKISTKKEPLISQKSQTLRFYLYSISPNCTILA